MNSLRRENSSLRESLLTGQLKHEVVFSCFITQESKMKAIFGYLDAVAETGQPVLIAGETGVGKERLVKALHIARRPKGDLVAVNPFIGILEELQNKYQLLFSFYDEEQLLNKLNEMLIDINQAKSEWYHKKEVLVKDKID